MPPREYSLHLRRDFAESGLVHPPEHARHHVLEALNEDIEDRDNLELAGLRGGQEPVRHRMADALGHAEDVFPGLQIDAITNHAWSRLVGNSRRLRKARMG